MFFVNFCVNNINKIYVKKELDVKCVKFFYDILNGSDLVPMPDV